MCHRHGLNTITGSRPASAHMQTMHCVRACTESACTVRGVISTGWPHSGRAGAPQTTWEPGTVSSRRCGAVWQVLKLKRGACAEACSWLYLLQELASRSAR